MPTRKQFKGETYIHMRSQYDMTNTIRKQCDMTNSRALLWKYKLYLWICNYIYVYLTEITWNLVSAPCNQRGFNIEVARKLYSEIRKQMTLFEISYKL